MSEAHAIELLDELDRIARRSAGHAMEKSLARRHDQIGRFVVFVERAAPDEIFAAVLAQLDTARADQRGQIGFVFNPLDFFVGDSWHGG